MDEYSSQILTSTDPLKLSILVVCHNSQAKIGQCLDAIVDFAPEIIVIDDGSEDSTLSELRKYIHRYNNIRVLINQYHEGLAVCRNRALISTQADVIAVQDIHTKSSPTRFARQMERFRQDPQLSLVGCYLQKTDNNNNPVGSVTYPPASMIEMFQCILQNFCSPVLDPTIAFRRETILSIGGFNSSHDFDSFDLVCRLLLNNLVVLNLAETLVSVQSGVYDIIRYQQTSREIAAKFACRSYESFVVDPRYFTQDCFTELKNDIPRRPYGDMER